MNTVVFMTKASFSARRPFSMEQSHSHAEARKARSRGSFAASLAAAAGGYTASFALIAACSHPDDGVTDCSNGMCACPGESTRAASYAAAQPRPATWTAGRAPPCMRERPAPCGLPGRSELRGVFPERRRRGDRRARHRSVRGRHADGLPDGLSIACAAPPLAPDP